MKFLGMLAMLCWGCIMLSAVETVELRGFGAVKAEFSPAHAVFQCESAEKADQLMGKLIADWLWDANPQKQVPRSHRLSGRDITVYELPGYGAAVIGRVDDTIAVCGGESTEAALRAAAADPLLSRPECLFRPQKPYPLYFDSLDLRAVKFYTHALLFPRREKFEDYWKFIRKYALGGISFNLGGGMVSVSPSPGIFFNYAALDFMVRAAEKHGEMIVPSFGLSGEMPLWMANRYPKSVNRTSPYSLDDKLNYQESVGIAPERSAEYGMNALREAVARYRNSPAVGAWQFYAGPGGIEVSHDFRKNTDFSPDGIADFRKFLRQEKKYDLNALSQRYGRKYTKWEEVLPLDCASLFGDLERRDFLMPKNWQYLPAARVKQLPVPDQLGWKTIGALPSPQLNRIPRQDTYYRVSFDASEFLKKNANRSIQLVIGEITPQQRNQTQVWLNGHHLGFVNQLTGGFYQKAAAVNVDGLLRTGDNELMLLVPRGYLFSPCFLTTGNPEHYPTSDPHLNARYVDHLDWLWTRNLERHVRTFTLARQLDPDRVFTLASGGAWQAASGVLNIASELGVTLQNTGREAFYQPWWARLARATGKFYGSAEPGSTVTTDITRPASINRLLGWMLIDGDSSLIFFWNLEDYLRAERETGWFSRNHRLLRMVGKSLPELPKLAILRSELSARCLERDAQLWNWDLGRGELNALHYNWGYVSEYELEHQLPPQTRVVIDSGSEIMTAQTVEALEKFVAGGGTLVALHNTGRHDPVYANSWPISRLTGCRVLPGAGAGKIRFAADLPLFRAWSGREFDGEGRACCWTGENTAAGTALRLKPDVPGVKILARWSDGSAAVTRRKLGRGQVIWLGSSFWRDGYDSEGAWHSRDSRRLEVMLEELGIERNSRASTPRVWVSDAVTKNGLEQWLIAFNTSRKPLAAELSFRCAVRPEAVREVISGTPVKFEYRDGFVILKDVTFTNTQTQIFAVRRANLVQALPQWWLEKCRYWRRPPEKVVAATISAPVEQEAQTLRIEQWKFCADAEGKINSAHHWLSSDFDDSSWDTIGNGPWNHIKATYQDYTGIGLYRAEFELPTSWRKGSVRLHIFATHAPPVLGEAEFYVNGAPLTDKKFLQCIPCSTEIGDRLKPGKNLIAIRIRGGKVWLGNLLSGLGGSVYLEACRPFEQTQSLDRCWQLADVAENLMPVKLPLGNRMGKYLAAEVEIPTAWRGKTIMLQLETSSDWIDAVMVGNRYFVSPRFRRLGCRFELNITNEVVPGRKVRIELWGKAFPNSEWPQNPLPETGVLNLETATIGCR